MVKRADTWAGVLGGSLAGADVEYLNALYAAGAQGSFNGLALHPYSGTRSPADNSDPRWGYERGVDDIRAVLRSHGGAPIWIRRDRLEHVARRRLERDREGNVSRAVFRHRQPMERGQRCRWTVAIWRKGTKGCVARTVTGRVAHTARLYHAATRVRADRTGHFSATVRLHYRAKKGTAATLMVTVCTPQGQASRRMGVRVVLPPSRKGAGTGRFTATTRS